MKNVERLRNSFRNIKNFKPENPEDYDEKLFNQVYNRGYSICNDIFELCPRIVLDQLEFKLYVTENSLIVSVYDGDSTIELLIYKDFYDLIIDAPSMDVEYEYRIEDYDYTVETFQSYFGKVF